MSLTIFRSAYSGSVNVPHEKKTLPPKNMIRKIKGLPCGSPLILVSDLLNYVRIVVEIGVSPVIKVEALGIVRLDNINYQNGNNEYDAGNNSPLEESSVSVGGLILAIEGLGATGNSTGETVLVALLKKNYTYNRESGNDKNRYENVL